ncbi:hypothetical protein GE09DRAFT_1280434 [Coniochaeta sp. 2T2.1]|nr:hypothetical protein GE09DRAFT_1280434 [Coniochaeta sp. 2T2.1]
MTTHLEIAKKADIRSRVALPVLPALLTITFLQRQGIPPCDNLSITYVPLLAIENQPAHVVTAHWVRKAVTAVHERYGILHPLNRQLRWHPHFLGGETWEPNRHSFKYQRSILGDRDTALVDVVSWAVLRAFNRGGVTAMSLHDAERWLPHIRKTNPWLEETINVFQKPCPRKQPRTCPRKAIVVPDPFESIPLLEVESGGTVTVLTLPPSTELTLANIVSAFLNHHLARRSPSGTFILRFDDIDPSVSTSSSDSFQASILHDLSLLGISPDKTTRVSDHFSSLPSLVSQLTRQGHVYAGYHPMEEEEQLVNADADGQTLSSRRIKNREMLLLLPSDPTVARFGRMVISCGGGGGCPHLEEAGWCLRARLHPPAVADAATRNEQASQPHPDPVIVVCNPGPQHPTNLDPIAGKAYATQEFVRAVADWREGVSVAVDVDATSDREDRERRQCIYNSLQRALGVSDSEVPLVTIPKLDFTHTALSPSVLERASKTGKVPGWQGSTTTMTVRDLLRHGMQPSALREIVFSHAAGRKTDWSWEEVWAGAVVYCAVLNRDGTPVAPGLVVRTGKRYAKSVRGKMVTGPRIVISQSDALGLRDGEEVTLDGWGNAIVRGIDEGEWEGVTLESGGEEMGAGTDTVATWLRLRFTLTGSREFRRMRKITWLAAGEEGDTLVPVKLVGFERQLGGEDVAAAFERLAVKGKNELDSDALQLGRVVETVTRAFADRDVVDLKEGDVVLFARKGYFRVDRAYGDGNEPMVFWQIPNGLSKWAAKKMRKSCWY